jgi:hypothetical protein
MPRTRLRAGRSQVQILSPRLTKALQGARFAGSATAAFPGRMFYSCSIGASLCVGSTLDARAPGAVGLASRPACEAMLWPIRRCTTHYDAPMNLGSWVNDRRGAGRSSEKRRPATSKKILGRTLERAFWLSFVVFLVGVGLIVWASQEQGTAATVIANLGSSALIIGLVGVLYEVFLRGSLMSEMLDAVGLHESARSLGLVQLGECAQIDLKALAEKASQIVAMPLDPLRWAEHDFATIRRCARSRPLRVEVLLPAADQPYLAVLAERLGKPPAQVEQALDEAATGKLGEAWTSEPVHAEASLEVYRYSGLLATGLIMTDQVVAIEVGPLIRYGPLDREGYMIVADRDKSPLTRWIETQMSRERHDENFSQIDAWPRTLPKEATAPGTRGAG